MTTVRPAGPDDAPAWQRLRVALWPDGTEDEHAREIDRYFAGGTTEPDAVLLAVDGSGEAVGFVELSTRPCAEGCLTSPVGYLEGWYVAPGARRRGAGRALVRAAEEWARARGCSEFASDTAPDNRASAAAHRALGFDEVGLVLCFRKDLREQATVAASRKRKRSDPMNVTRITLAGLGAMVAYLAIGFLLLALLPLEGEVRRYAAVYRPPDAMNGVAPVGMAALLLAMLALAALYSLARREGPALAQGLHFGFLVGVLAAGSFVMHNYVSLNVGLRLVLLQALAYFVQWVGAGVAIALVYRPARP